MSFIGQPAPDFTAPAVMPDGQFLPEFHLHDFMKDKIAVIFFYSMDFSYICPTELVALNNRFNEFRKRDVAVVAISCDSQIVHQKWRSVPAAKGGIGDFRFPLIVDMDRRVSEGYGVCINNSLSLRATFITDKAGIVRHQSINDFQIGRNIDEVLRFIDAQIFYQETGKLCPANWQSGDPGFFADDKSLLQFMEKNAAML